MRQALLSQPSYLGVAWSSEAHRMSSHGHRHRFASGVLFVLMALTGFGLAWAPNLWVAYLWCVPFGVGGAAFIAGAAIVQYEPRAISAASQRSQSLAASVMAVSPGATLPPCPLR
ncbi:MAG: hypothetical protein HC923_01885, partial [Myxococcales bacterium]|nr:hypothetical protein [Myxococcales bacterium]